MKKTIYIDGRPVGEGHPTYIIAEIGSNFDRSIERAKQLIDLAKECGADAVKFQCFAADKIVSKEGFEGLKTGFQAGWKKPVYEVYQDAEFPRNWHQELKEYCKQKNITFFSAPYDREAVDMLEKHEVPAYKIGSGDITWLEHIEYVACKGKPVLIACGASTLAEVDEAMQAIRKTGNNDVVLLQCVTNYPSTFESANLRAMKAMGETFNVLTGYSDHTPGSIVPLGAVAMGACVIEKHFTDDKTREGPDHPHAMDGKDFKEMVDGIRALEKSMGSPRKDVYAEEHDTYVLQRRCIRATRDIASGETITDDMLVALRPQPRDTLLPKYATYLVGKKIKKPVAKGKEIKWEHIDL
jgi:sialic acid synthase SpsE